jgi:hypothetical protein
MSENGSFPRVFADAGFGFELSLASDAASTLSCFRLVVNEISLYRLASDAKVAFTSRLPDRGDFYLTHSDQAIFF